MFTRVLVATDFSAASEAALEYGGRIAAQFHASVHVLHVVEDPEAAGFFPEIQLRQARLTRDAMLQKARQRLALHVATAAGRSFGVSAEAVIGLPAETIVAYAAANGFDVIVLGGHERSALAHALLGNVAGQVIRTATCPVLTVPEPRAMAHAGGRRTVPAARPE
jgi:nucleotide-binding universal stress UspA family protein